MATTNETRDPSTTKLAFHCPRCSVFANQKWHKAAAAWAREGWTPSADIVVPISLAADSQTSTKLAKVPFEFIERNSTINASYIKGLSFSECSHCHLISIWADDGLMWPTQSQIAAPSSDMPVDVRQDYEEAALIVDKSPRGAAALLRLALQKLCMFLGEPGKNLNTDIGGLVKKGLDLRVQRAFDILRVSGNSMVHPGELDAQDNRETAEKMFQLLNVIIELQITQPAKLNAMYGALGSNVLSQIETRDAKKDG